MSEDPALLRRYVETHDEAAFTALVRRHLDGVYSVALRRVGGDAHLAHDVAQQVFAGLARDARRLTSHPTLTGWLYTATRYAAANVVRTERRRKHRETEALTMQQRLSEGPPEADWNQLAPVLEQAVDRLSEPDRTAILLRFIERCSFADIGSALRLGEDAARKRVDRAMEKLRTELNRRGIVSTASALTAVLTAHAISAAPAGMAAVVAEAAMTGAAGGGGGLAILTFMSTTKVQAGAIAVIVALGALGLLLQQRTHAQLTEQLSDARNRHREYLQLANENDRLAQAIAHPDAADQADLATLQTQAADLRQRLADAQPKLAPGLVAMTAWKNRGRATPGATLETMFWAKEGGDIVGVGKMIGLSAATRSRLADAFASIPDDARAKLGVSSPEELVALAWTVGTRSQLLGAGVSGVVPNGPDAATLQLWIEKADGTLLARQEMAFRQTPDGWQWIVDDRDLERIGLGEIMKLFDGQGGH